MTQAYHIMIFQLFFIQRIVFTSDNLCTLFMGDGVTRWPKHITCWTGKGYDRAEKLTAQNVI
jgi:hypothetical protein